MAALYLLSSHTLLMRIKSVKPYGEAVVLSALRLNLINLSPWLLVVAQEWICARQVVVNAPT